MRTVVVLDGGKQEGLRTVTKSGVGAIDYDEGRGNALAQFLREQLAQKLGRGVVVDEVPLEAIQRTLKTEKVGVALSSKAGSSGSRFRSSIRAHPTWSNDTTTMRPEEGACVLLKPWSRKS